MRKKIGLVLSAILLICPFVLVGCGQEDSPYSNISEITKVYYQGASDDARGSISVGQREDPYKLDGKHNQMYDFSLVVIEFNEQLQENTIDVALTINDSTQTFTMYFNPLSSSYMADIGYLLGDNDKINITYQEFSIDFYNVSDSFSISYEEALDIAIENMDLQGFYEDGQFKGECYLRILTEKDDNFEDLFWIFSVVGENGEVKNIVINVESGEILS